MLRMQISLNARWVLFPKLFAGRQLASHSVGLEVVRLPVIVEAKQWHPNYLVPLCMGKYYIPRDNVTNAQAVACSPLHIGQGDFFF